MTIFRPQFITWIDPGKLTGAAWYEVTTERFGSGQYSEDGITERLGSLFTSNKGKDMALGYERYCSVGGPNAGISMYSNSVIGSARTIAREHGVTVLQPVPSSARKISKAEMLRMMGWYKPGLVHANDAAQHLLAWILRTPPIPLRIRRVLYATINPGGTVHP